MSQSLIETSGLPPAVGRLAPSPTGGLHIGHARTFLLAWLSARAAGGRVILRIEDIDTTRVRPGASEAMVEDLRRLGLDWDEGPYAQSERIETYEAALGRLKRKNLIYPCTCTRAEIERAASAPHREDEPSRYPGMCAGRSSEEGAALGNRPFGWRFRVGDAAVSWEDLYAGSMGFDASRIGGDFIVARSPFVPSYQLAVIQDDAAMGVTQVIRGEDLIPSTPRQLLLADALDLGSRRYGHIPLVVGPDGRRLAKRDGSIKLASLYEAGVDSNLIIGWIVRSFGWTKDIHRFQTHELINRFDPGVVQSGPCVLDPADLRV